MRSKLLTVALMPLSLLVAYVTMEIAYRGYLYYLYVFQPGFAVTTIDVRSSHVIGTPGSVFGYYQPNKPITFSYYLPDGRMAQRHTVHINNYGWPSRYDYVRAKPASEFRIAAIGDSMTASINNAVPWPDVVQRNLDADAELKRALGVERITVLNLGIAGASMQYMVNPLAGIARRFSADFVIVNFIADDLRRRHSDVPLPTEPEPVNDTPPPITQPDIEVDGVGIDLRGCEPRLLSNPACHVSPYFTVSPGTQLSEEEINSIKAKLAAPVFWSRIISSAKPLLLLEVIGRPAVPRLPAPKVLKEMFRSQAEIPVLMSDVIQSDAKEAEDLSVAVRSIREIHRMHPQLMLLHTPTYWYLAGQLREAAVQPLGDALQADGLQITDMRKYLPIDASERDWFTWYNLPHDGHWNDAGAEVYGLAVYRAVRERLLATRQAGRAVPAAQPAN
jgi:hypothetical protein